MPARNGSNLSSSSTSRPRPSGNDDHRNLLSTDGSPGDDFRSALRKGLRPTNPPSTR